MTEQLEIPIARASDPITSHEAAEEHTRSGRRQTHTERVARAVRRTPGLTSAELSLESGIPERTVSKRVSDAEKRGWIKAGAPRRCSVTGCSARPWSPGDTAIGEG